MQTANSTMEPTILHDGDGAKSERADNLHLTRYIEMFLAFQEPTTGNLVAACYNSMYSSAGIPESRDTSPSDLVAGIDFEQLKKDYNLLGASLNGPKLILPDWVELTRGVERDFNGVKACWVAQLNSGKDVTKSEAYAPMTIARDSGIGWNKGTTALLLDDAEGNTWIMKGFQLGLNPQYTYEEFVAAGEKNFKKLPPGWTFRIKTLEQDLIEIPEGGVATIMPDEFFNMYDKTGPGMTNYKP